MPEERARRCRRRRRGELRCPVWTLPALVMALAAPAAAQDRWEVSLALGKAWPRAADVDLSLPGGTDLRFHDVSLDDQSFTSPLYWSVRLAYWLPRASDWGVALETTHAKAFAEVHQSVTVTGTRDGAAVHGRELVSATIQHFAMSHGLNLSLLQVLHRWGSGNRARRPIQPFVGLGVGVAWPHVEAVVGPSQTYAYQVTGPAADLVAGVRGPLSVRWAVVMEGKLAWADVTADLRGGGEIRVRPWLGQLTAGVSVGF